jgi:hypothetical protein
MRPAISCRPGVGRQMGHFEAKDELKEIRNEDVRDQGIRVLEER